MALPQDLTYLNRRRFDRYPVNLRGTAIFDSASTSVRVLDLSIAGARIELPLHALAYDLGQLATLRIVHVLQLRVRWRWYRDRQVGLEFTSRTLARDSLIHLLDQEAPEQEEVTSDG